MRRLVASLAIAGLFAFTAAPVLAAAAEHSSFPVAGTVIDCGAQQYTFTSGTFDVVTHVVDSTTGGDWRQLTVDAHADKVTAVDAAGNPYRVVGIFHFGGSVNVNTNSGPFHFGMKLQIVAQGGGAVDNVNAGLNVNPFGGGKDFFSIGTCAPLG